MALLLVRHAAPDIDPARPATEWGLSPGGRDAVVAHGTVIALHAAPLVGAEPLALWRSLALPDVVELCGL